MAATKKVLPKDAESRIVIRNNVLDNLPDMQLEKAEFLIDRLCGEYAGFLPTKEHVDSWVRNRDAICLMICMVEDYMLQARNMMEDLKRQLNEANQAEIGGNQCITSI